MKFNSKKETVRLNRKNETCMIIYGNKTICVDPSLPIFHLLGKKYTILIIAYLGNEQKGRSFNDILMGIPGSSNTIISSRLRELEKNGLIEKNTSERIVYRLTEKGLIIREAIIPVVEAIEKNVALFL